MTAPKLKPCPFCGKAARPKLLSDNPAQTFFECGSCHWDLGPTGIDLRTWQSTECKAFIEGRASEIAWRDRWQPVVEAARTQRSNHESDGEGPCDCVCCVALRKAEEDR